MLKIHNRYRNKLHICICIMTIEQKPFILKNTTALKNKTITHLYRQHQ